MPRRFANALILAAILIAGNAHAQITSAPAPQLSTSTADHSTFEVLKKEFMSGPEVTEACLSCHTEADNQVMDTIHYNWDYQHSGTGQSLGKRTVVNAFCGNVAGNEARCTSCHVGYGWEDMNQPPPQQSQAVDCLICHDQSGQYTKSATGAGHPPLDPVAPKTKTITGAPAWAVDLNKAALSVGNPDRESCGQCHFYGGGGDNVKHGDLSSALVSPDVHVDVHMSPDGANMVCSDCHQSTAHQWPGSRYDVMASDPLGTGLPGQRRDVATCESCHGNTPHPVTLKGVKLNDHTDTVACQTCHIPEFAKGGVATKTSWDWSTAGRMDENGKPIVESNFTQSDGQHLHTYMSKKGDFEWAENVEPHYAWFNGQVEYTTADRTIDPSQTVEINHIGGQADDGKSRIWPFKRMEGRQAYDVGLNRLAFTHVWGPDSDTAYWTNFDWGKSVEAGMSAAGVEYSGEYGFVDTYMYWPITHMVAPADEALECESCHAADGRLAGIDGPYMPGTGTSPLVGTLGKLIVLLTALGLLGHAAIRLVTRKSDGGQHG